MTGSDWLRILVLTALASPALLLASLILAAFWQRRIGEKAVAHLTGGAMLVCFIALLAAFLLYVFAGLNPEVWTARSWFAVGGGSFRFDVLVDGWSLSFALLAATICGTVVSFSYRYLHREPGFYRYFLLFTCFVIGILFVALAGSVEVLFAGWELLGLSSTLLVAFFHERRAPVINAMRVFATYRVSDAAMLAAAILIHHSVGSGDLSALFRGATAGLSANTITAVSVFILIAVAGKSALLPFSGWLPRAMEGPTPSSAVYYGALSVHAGCYLLWRAGPLLEQSMVARILAGTAGAATAIYATGVAKVQTDIKSGLCYATLAQVGIIVVEIAFGLRILAFVHMLGHACFRLVQFLSAPNIIEDSRALERASPRNSHAPSRRKGLYLFFLERGFVDPLIDRLLVAPFLGLARRAQRLDHFLAGERSAPEK